MTTPAEGTSRPARILSTVVLPQPEWPMMQVNSPRRIDSHKFSNTTLALPPGAGKRLEMPSIEMNLSGGIAASFREGHEVGQSREHLIENHADDPDHQYRGDDIGDR